MCGEFGEDIVDELDGCCCAAFATFTRNVDPAAVAEPCLAKSPIPTPDRATATPGGRPFVAAPLLAKNLLACPVTAAEEGEPNGDEAGTRTRS